LIAPWLTLEDFLIAANISRRTFYRNRSAYETKPNGRTFLIASASLPEAVRAKLETLNAPRKELLRPLRPAQAIAPLFTNGMALLGPGRRLVLREILHRAGETEVQVCFDPNAPETAVVTSMDGIKLCDVRAERFVTQSIEAGPMIAASLQERRGLRNNDAASIRNLRRDVAKAGHKTDAEHLFARAQQVMRERGIVDEPHLLPMAVGDHITQRVMTEAPSRAAAPRYAHEIAMAAAMEDE
jgi:hypothetical protein